MIQQILIGIGLLAGIVGCLFNPFAGLVTLMGVNMVQPGELYPIYNALHTERLMALLALVMLFAKGYRFVFPAVTKKVLYFYAACVATIPLSFWIGNSINSAMDFGKIIVLHLLYVALVTTRRRMQIVLVFFGTLVGYLAITSLILYYQGQFDFTMNIDRIAGLTNASNSPDALGLTLCTALPIMFLFTRRPCSTRLRVFMAILIVLGLWTLLFTGSRGAVLSLLLVVGIAVLISRRRMITIPISIATCLLVWALLPAQYKARYVSVNNLKNDESYQNRFLSWAGGWNMFLHNPVTGVGIGNYTDANGGGYYPGGRHVYINAHSLYFKLLGELGLAGTLTFAAFVTTLIRTNNRLRRDLRTLAARAAAGHPRAEAVPEWMRLLPTTCTLCIIALLYCGYAYHDLYRSTWYFLAAVSGAMYIMVRKELDASAAPMPAAEPTQQEPSSGAAAAAWWSARGALEGERG